MSKTILLIHGAWLTHDSWSNFRGYFQSKGYSVVAPPWPYMEKAAVELRANPDPRLAKTTIKDLVDHFEKHVLALPEAPILIGHSFGGLIVQMLLDRGLGVAGVAIDAGPPRGVIPSFTAIKSALPVLLTWRGWQRTLTMSFKAFATTFANTVPADQQPALYDECIVPAPGRIFFQAALGIGNGVNWANPDRPPLLLIAASKDKTAPTSMIRAMFKKHSQAPSRTAFQEFPDRSHWLCTETGWEEVADAALNWALLHGASQPTL